MEHQKTVNHVDQILDEHDQETYPYLSQYLPQNTGENELTAPFYTSILVDSRGRHFAVGHRVQLIFMTTDFGRISELAQIFLEIPPMQLPEISLKQTMEEL